MYVVILCCVMGKIDRFFFLNFFKTFFISKIQKTELTKKKNKIKTFFEVGGFAPQKWQTPVRMLGPGG